MHCQISLILKLNGETIVRLFVSWSAAEIQQWLVSELFDSPYIVG